MGFAKRRKSIITGKRWFSTVLSGTLACLSGGIVHAQMPGLTAPQKQVVTFTFGLGSSELNERYGQNSASMARFGELIGQVAETPAAHIDSVVITSYSTSADQLGNVETAQQRVEAVKAYLEPVIRTSQLRQAVILTGKVVARNNVFMPNQMFDMLKKVNVTVYLNGLLVAKADGGLRGAGSAAEEEQRYVSPFGTGQNVFGRKAEPEMRTEQVVPAPRTEPVQSVIAEGKDNNTVNDELQRFIDSMTMSSHAKELPAAPFTAASPAAVNQPEASPLAGEKDLCPQDRDPEIDALIRRLLAEQEATGAGAELPILPASKKIEIEEIGSVATGRVSDSKRSAIVEFEITGDPELVSEVADARKIKVKPVKEAKVKPVKAVKAPREPLVLVRPIVAVKTNLAYWAAVAANLEAEFYFAKRWSAAVEGVYTSWDMNLYKKHYAVNEISPEVRYWTGRKAGQYRGFYIGVYGHVGQFDYMFANQTTGNTGDYYGAGISLGAYLPFSRHFGMELGLRGGFVHADYDRYYYDAPHYMYQCSKSINYLGPTGAKVSLVYRFGLGRQ